MKNYLGKCNLKATFTNGVCSDFLVSNPEIISEFNKVLLKFCFSYQNYGDSQ